MAGGASNPGARTLADGLRRTFRFGDRARQRADRIRSGYRGLHAQFRADAAHVTVEDGGQPQRQPGQRPIVQGEAATPCRRETGRSSGPSPSSYDHQPVSRAQRIEWNALTPDERLTAEVESRQRIPPPVSACDACGFGGRCRVAGRRQRGRSLARGAQPEGSSVAEYAHRPAPPWSCPSATPRAPSRPRAGCRPCPARAAVTAPATSCQGRPSPLPEHARRRAALIRTAGSRARSRVRAGPRPGRGVPPDEPRRLMGEIIVGDSQMARRVYEMSARSDDHRSP